MVWVTAASTTANVVITSTTTAATWQNWNEALYGNTTSTSTTMMLIPSWQSWNFTYEETREQQEARERREAAARADLERRRAERQLAAERAEELLLSLLTDEQTASYRERGWFEVRGSRGGRWRIRNRSQSGNVDLMPEIGEERDASFCAHPPDSLPAADAHLAQMLALVTDEDQFLKVANRCYTRPVPVAVTPQAA